jgi:hypothetical protein
MSTKFCRLHSIGPRVAILIFSATAWLAPMSAATATVPPAPIIDKPLTPAVNDTPGDQPSVQHVWVPGHWRWSEGAYVWEMGRWEIPPAANVVWHAPEWQKQANGYILREGYWDEAPPQPATVVSAPQVQAPPPAQEIVVTAPPPPPQREVIVERPTPTHVWVSGYWAWRGGRHVWVPGHWAAPPRSNVVWVPSRWEHRSGRYVFVDGYWRDAVYMSQPAPQSVVVSAPPPQVQSPPQQQVIVVAAPPPPRQEVVYSRPSRAHIWVPGYWSWHHGRYVWIAGHYDLPPRGRATWVEPRWERRGGNYLFVEGHWR